MTDREKLPNRRMRTPIEFEHQGHRFTGGAGHYPDGRVGEVFLSGNKPNSPRDIEVKDAAIAASLALQYGCPLEVMRHALLRDDAGVAAGPLGRLMDHLGDAPVPMGFIVVQGPVTKDFVARLRAAWKAAFA
jgi:hypothetical protein